MFEQVEQVLKVLKMLTFLGAAFLSNWLLDEVSPPDSTALVTAVENPSNVRLETSRLGPKMTGLAGTEDCRGMILQQIASIYRGLAFILIFGIERFPEGAKRRGLREGNETGQAN